MIKRGRTAFANLDFSAASFESVDLAAAAG